MAGSEICDLSGIYYHGNRISGRLEGNRSGNGQSDDHSCIDWNRSFQRKLKRSDRKTISEQRASGCCIFHSVFLCKCWGFRRFTAYPDFCSLHLFKKGDVLGFRQCFFVASIWCIVGLAWFVLNWKNLQGQGVKPFKYLTDENGNVIGSNEKKEDGKNDKQPLTKLERNRMIAIILVSALSVIFWLFYYQQDLALVILYDRLCEDEYWLFLTFRRHGLLLHGTDFCVSFLVV